MRTTARAVLPLWLWTRVGVALLSLAAARVATGEPGTHRPGLGTLWMRWDADLFRKVARDGYFSPAYHDRTEVDWPGFPLALRLVHLVARDWRASGLVVSALAGAVSCVALWLLAADEAPGPRGEQAGRWAVAALVAAPYGVFLFAGYSEGLFLAFATAGWLAARRGRWALAGLLVAGAAATRVLGIPLAVALAVEWVTLRWRAQPAGLRARVRALLHSSALWLALPALPVLAYTAYLHAHTGHWDSYTRAMREGWGRTLAAPWTGWRTTWAQALNAQQSAAFLWFWRAELAAVVLGVLLTVLLARSRRWGEATFVGTSTLLMSASSYYASGVRAALVWFPFYLLLGRVAADRGWTRIPLLVLGGALQAAFVVAFTSGDWVD